MSEPMTITKEHIAKVVVTGNWIIRADNDGASHGGFCWAPLGEWTTAPDWNDRPECGGGLHGQDKDHGGYIQGTRLVFCETRGKHVAIGSNKVKVQSARILMVNALPEGLSVGGSLDLSSTAIKKVPKSAKIASMIYR